MKCYIENCLFLSGRKGSFTSKEGEQISFQNAEFFQVDTEGGSVNFKVAKEVDVDSLEPLKAYNLECSVSSFQSGIGIRVVAVEERF